MAFGFEVDSASEKQAENSIKGIKNLATKLLGSIAVYFSVQGLSGLAQAAADVEALNSQFSQVFGDIEDKAAASLQGVADEGGALVMRMKGSFTQLAAFTKTTGATAEEALTIAERGMLAAADSAAFYDRSLEDVTASLQSFLKGNFEQDSALGLSCTEITRNTAANELYGKSFKDLTEYQKQLTLLKMVEDANKMSGALGQAARESDTWTNQLGNLKQSIQDLKAAAGSGFLKPGITVLKLLASLVQKATVHVKKLTAENGAITKGMEKAQAIIKRLQPAAERMLQATSKGLLKVKAVASDVITRLGGLKNVFKILGLTMGAVGILKAVTQFKKFLGVIKAISKASMLAKLKLAAIIAVIVLVALLVEDFINFMKGNDSVLGSLFDKTGIGADKARKAIVDAFTKVKNFIMEVWPAIKETLLTVWEAIKVVAKVVFDAIATVVKTVFEWLKKFWDAWGTRIIAFFKVMWDKVGGMFYGFLEIIKGVANFVKSVFTGDWEGAWEAIKQIFVGVWEMLKNYISGVWEYIKLVFEMAWEGIKGIFSGVGEFFKGVWDSIVGIFTSIGTAIADAISGAVRGAINGVLNTAAGIINGFIKAINLAIGVINAIPGVKINKLEELEVPQLAKGGVATDATHAVVGEGSEPEAIMPLSKLGSMIRGYVKDARESEAMKVLTSGVSALNRAVTANQGTAMGGVGRTYSIVQNNEFNNSYYGGDREATKNVSKGMKKSAVDATTQMANAIAYARG